MRQLTLLRHGDALPSARGGRDFDRPLSDRGVLEVRGAARAIAAGMPRPDLILASSARRTTETAELVQATAWPDAPLLTEAALYCATADALLEVLRGLGDGFASVLLVGHNPGISEACSRLAGDGRPLALPTAGWRRYDAPYLARGSFSPIPG
jgi:phosphohistidine phosphatase